MSRSLPPVEVKVWGDFACFTRPEMKVERVSYDVMTPSAARNILQAIFWKPQFDYMIEEIQVLREIKRLSILRNEVTHQASERSIKKWEENGDHLFIEHNRTQRHALVLRDVAYIIKAQICLRSGVTDNVAKYRDQLRRRVVKGRCFWRPYLGCREFSAFFGEVEGDEKPIELSTDLGRMLFDLDYDDSKKKSRGEGSPIFFPARLERGVLDVPSSLYKPLLANKESR